MLAEERKVDIVEEVEIDQCYYVDTERQVVKWLRNQDDPTRMDEGVQGYEIDEDPYEDCEEGGYMSDDAANRRAL